MFVCVCAASNRQQLVTAGAIPVLVKLLQSQDEDVQYYSAAAISNLAVDGNTVHTRSPLHQRDVCACMTSSSGMSIMSMHSVVRGLPVSLLRRRLDSFLYCSLRSAA